jgi:type I restriction enzyme R subunit
LVYRLLGERLQRIKQRKDATDQATEDRLHELQTLANDWAQTNTEPERLNLTQPGEYELFTVLRNYAATQEESYLADCAKRMIAHLQVHQLLTPGWSHAKGGRMRVEQSLLVESWNPVYAPLGFDPDDPEPPFVGLALAELAKLDG